MMINNIYVGRDREDLRCLSVVQWLTCEIPTS